MPCKLCQNPKNIKDCENCKASVCKNCVHFVEKENLRFLSKRPKVLEQNKVFCHDCYINFVEPELEKYQALVNLAEEMHFLSKNYKGSLPIKRKAKAPFSVKRHEDKGQAILHLKFLAAQAGYNAIVYGVIENKKIRNHAFETKEWQVTGLAVELDLAKLERLERDYI